MTRRAGYLSWDDPGDRERILRRQLPASRLWVFDELHKYRQWRNYLKGLFDKRPGLQQILVTGSGRLDFYGFGARGTKDYQTPEGIRIAPAMTLLGTLV